MNSSDNAPCQLKPSQGVDNLQGGMPWFFVSRFAWHSSQKHKGHTCFALNATGARVAHTMVSGTITAPIAGIARVVVLAESEAVCRGAAAACGRDASERRHKSAYDTKQNRSKY